MRYGLNYPILQKKFVKCKNLCTVQGHRQLWLKQKDKGCFSDHTTSLTWRLEESHFKNGGGSINVKCKGTIAAEFWQRDADVNIYTADSPDNSFVQVLGVHEANWPGENRVHMRKNCSQLEKSLFYRWSWLCTCFSICGPTIGSDISSDMCNLVKWKRTVLEPKGCNSNPIDFYFSLVKWRRRKKHSRQWKLSVEKLTLMEVFGVWKQDISGLWSHSHYTMSNCIDI